MPDLFTIGVYGFTLATFIAELDRAGVHLIVDVRQRRGVRGSEYAWANSRRLQDALATAGIAYEHQLELAPTTAMRKAVYAEDDKRGIARRDRFDLTPAYVESYTAEILDHADLEALAATIRDRGPAALLCVERVPEACHRSLIAARMADRYAIAIGDIVASD